MGVPGSADLMVLATAAQAAGGYEIEQSLRFDGSSTYLSRTPGSDTSTNKKGTFSVWIKSLPGSGTNGGTFIGAADSYYYAQFFNERFYFGNTTSYIDVQGQRRDPSAWYHFVCVFDTTLATSNDRMKIYVNGVRQDTQTYNVQPSQNSSFEFLNTAQEYNLGRRASGSSVYFDGYFAELHFVDGQALDPTDFGEEDDNGVWRPISYTGSYGTNGFYLKFDPTATNGIGHDHSGNGNNWTAYNFTTSGTGTDVFSDTPTTNYPTLNPISVNANLPSGYTKRPPFNGNLSVTFGQGQAGIDANFGITPGSGKFYWEVQVDTDGNNVFTTRWGVLLDGSNWDIRNNQDIASVVDGDILGFALDANAGTFNYYLNGTLLNNQQTFPSTWKLAVPWMGVSSNGSRPNSQYTFNFGQRAFAQTPPTGFSALNTANLPAPDIADPATAFDVVTYEGTGTTNTLTVDFSPNFAWIKRYDDTGDNILVDTLRGSTPPYRLITNGTGSELTTSDGVNSFSSTGVVLDGTGGGGGDVNQTSRFYWAAQWDGNGTGTTNTAGGTQSTVSANATAGFSIVNFYPTAYDTATTVGHGLGVPPEMIIVKSRGSSANWDVYHSSQGASKKGYLNSSDAFFTSGAWGSTAPTSSVFTFNPGGQNNNNHIAYCFVSIEGYSKVGAYVGNASSDGPFVYTGFKPKFIIFKNASSSNRNWSVMNSLRIPYNGTYARTRADSNLGESDVADSASAVDFLSNGFKLKGDSSNTNRNGETHIYLAFAENPFGGDGVSPATAR